MPRSLFISDLHLDTARPATLDALGQFLDNNRDVDALYILGDLFEAWLGDDDDSPLAAEIRTLLRAYSDGGPHLFLMQGNRDFLIGEELCRAVGAALLADPTVIDLYGKRTLLMHGDSLCTADTDYQAFRQTARDPDWQAQLLARTLAERRAIADQLRAASKDAGSNKAEDIMDVTPDEVDRVMQHHGVDCLIHGHTHRPATHSQDRGQRWVLGDWDQQGWYIEASPSSMELINFPINQ